jgi:hypothetical protein
MVEKARWKALELILPRKIVNQKKYSIPGEMAEINATTKDLKNAEVVIFTAFSVQVLAYLAHRKKQMDFGERQWIKINESDNDSNRCCYFGYVFIT